MTYDMLVGEFTRAPRDVRTVPTTKREGVTFYVSAKGGKLLVEAGRSGEHRSRVARRTLQENECEEMLALWQRRKKGEPVYREAQERTVSQVYWYGIFAELGL